MLAGRCGTKLRPISEPPPRALNFDAYATRRPRGSLARKRHPHGTEGSAELLPHRIHDGSSSHNSETAHICTEIGWVPQEIAPSKDKQDPAQCSSARTRKVLASFGTVKHEPGDTMILPKGRIAGYSSLSPSHHYHHRHSSLHMSQVSQSPTIRYLIQQF